MRAESKRTVPKRLANRLSWGSLMSLDKKKGLSDNIRMRFPVHDFKTSWLSKNSIKRSWKEGTKQGSIEEW